MRSSIKFIVSVMSLIMSFTLAVRGGTIIQDKDGAGWQIQSYSPIGQTFTAEDTQIKSIGFGVFEINPQLPLVPVTIKVYEGMGTGGTLLGSAPLSGLQPGFDGFFDADFGSLTLLVGHVYSAVLSTTSERAAVYGAWWKSDIDGHIIQPDPYTGGKGFNNESQHNLGEFDLMFRVYPVPEPATLLLLGLGGLAVIRRRKR